MNERIKELRKSLKLNQTDFGDRIGVKQATIAGYENGSRQPIDAVITANCREFGVNEEWLRTGSGEMFREVDTEARFSEWAGRVLAGRDETFQKRFVTMMMSLTEDQWRLLEEKARMLFDQEQNKKA